MSITLNLIRDTLSQLGGKASCCEIAGAIHQQGYEQKYSEVDLTVRRIVYTHCPQHVEEYLGQPVFEALDARYYGFWNPSKKYSDRYVQAL